MLLSRKTRTLRPIQGRMPDCLGLFPMENGGSLFVGNVGQGLDWDTRAYEQESTTLCGAIVTVAATTSRG